MKPGDLVVTKRDSNAALELENGEMIGIEGLTTALVLDIGIDPFDPHNNEVRVLINGMVGVLWSDELEETVTEENNHKLVSTRLPVD